MVLHPPLAHLPIGAWVICVLATVIFFMVGLYLDLNKEKVNIEFMVSVAKTFENIAIFSSFFGFFSFLLTGYFGLLDASRQSISIIDILNLNILVDGLNFALINELLAFKIRWSLVLFHVMIFSLFIASFIHIKKRKYIFQIKLALRLLYVESIFFGFVLITMISFVGGFYVYGNIVLDTLPFLAIFLPENENLLISLFVSIFFINILILLSYIIIIEKINKF